MTKYNLINQSRIERAARALFDAAPLEDDPEKQEAQSNNEQVESRGFRWDELDEDAPSKHEFRALAAVVIEALDDELDEGLRQIQLPAVMAELTLLNKADALGVLYAAIERITETK